MQTLLPIATEIASLLKARAQTIAVAESAAGGLIAAALLAVPGRPTSSAAQSSTPACRAPCCSASPMRRCEGFVHRRSRTPRCWRERRANASAPIGPSPRPARQGRAAIATGTMPVTVAARSMVAMALPNPSRSISGAPTAKPTCAPSRESRSNGFVASCRCSCRPRPVWQSRLPAGRQHGPRSIERDQSNRMAFARSLYTAAMRRRCRESGWVRTHRSTEKFSSSGVSARSWGSSFALYVDIAPMPNPARTAAPTATKLSTR